MKIFGSITELVNLVFRKNGQAVTFRPNQATTYTASRDLQLPPGDAAHVLVSADSTQTLTNKTMSGASNTFSNISLTGSVTGILPGANGGTGINNTGTLTFGANSLTFSTGGATSLTLPASGTLATLAGSETLSNKTLASPDVTTQLRLLNQGQLQLREGTGGGTDQVNIQAPSTLAASYTLTLPGDDGTASQFLQTDGNGVLTWASAASNTLNQYNVNVGDPSNAAQATNTNLLGYYRAQYQVFTFTDANVNTTTDVITVTSHGQTTGFPVYLTTTGVLPTGLSANTRYYLINLTANTFKLATTLANAAANTGIDITAAAGGGTHTLVTGGIRSLVSYDLPGNPSNTAAPAGYIGEYIESNGASGTSVSNGTALNTASTTLSPGDWEVMAKAHFNNASFSSVTDFVIVSVSLVSATTNAKSQILVTPSSAAGTSRIGWANLRVTVAEGTTQVVYAACQANFTAGTCTTGTENWIIARRMR